MKKKNLSNFSMRDSPTPEFETEELFLSSYYLFTFNHLNQIRKKPKTIEANVNHSWQSLINLCSSLFVGIIPDVLPQFLRIFVVMGIVLSCKILLHTCMLIISNIYYAQCYVS